MDARFSPTASHREVARVFEVDEASVRRHRKHLGKDSFFGVPDQLITQRSITTRHEDGSYDKITWKPNAGIHMALDDTKDLDLKSIFDQPLPSPHPALGSVPVTKVITASDLQLGKSDEFGGFDDTMARIKQSLANIVAELEESRPAEIIFLDGGDVMENFNNTSTQAHTNDKDTTQQIRAARMVMALLVRTLAQHCDKLVYVTVPSNHCRVRSGPKAPISNPYDDYGIDVNHAVEEILEGRPEFAHVSFERPKNPYHEHVMYHSEISNTTLGFIHGHQKNSITALPTWLDEQVADNRGFESVSVLFTAHYHTFFMLPARGMRMVVGTPTQDNGSSWFTNKTGIRSGTGFLMCDVLEGRVFSPNIY
jgi:hypothetical protein